MCFYEQYVFACKDWKWGNFRQHCQKEYRTGETCGMKLCFQAVALPDKCKLCLKIEAKQRRFAKHHQDVSRWRQEPGRYSASIEKAIMDMKTLQAEVNQLISEKSDRNKMIGNVRRAY